MKLEIRLFFLPAVMMICAASLGAQQDDEFNSTGLGAQWSWVRENPGAWSLTGSGLEIRTEPGDLTDVPANIPATNSLKNILLQSTPEVTFRVETKLTFHPDTNYQNAGLIYYMDDDNYVRISRCVYGSFNGLLMEWEVAGNPVLRIVDGVNTDTILLRFSRTNGPYGNLYCGTYSLDGAVWQLIGMDSRIFSGSLPQPRIGIHAGNGVGARASGRSIPARFDYFRFALTGVEPEPARLTPFRISSLYPNPLPAAGGPEHVRFETSAASAVEFTIFDAAGRVLRSEHRDYAPGTHDHAMQISGLRRGMYFIRVARGDDNAIQSFLVE